MKQKQLLILACIFGVLLVVVLWPNISSSFGSKPRNELGLPAGDLNILSKIVIMSKGNELVLNHADDNWKAASYSADPKKIALLNDALGNLTVSNLASTNTENQKELEVTEESGISMQLVAGGNEYRYLIGKTGPSYETFYMRNADSSDVYLVSGQLRGALTTDISSWRDKTLVSVSKSALRKIEVVGGDDITAEKNKDSKWQVIYRGKSIELGEADVDQVLSGALSLSGYDVASENDLKSFTRAKEKITIRFTTDGGKPVELVAVLNDSDYLVRNMAASDVFKVYGNQLKSLLDLKEKVK